MERMDPTVSLRMTIDSGIVPKSESAVSYEEYIAEWSVKWTRS